MSINIKEGLKPFGYWQDYNTHEEKSQRKKDALALIDKNWANTQESLDVIKYLQNGTIVFRYKGYARNVLAEEGDPYKFTIIGDSCCMTPDSKWQYPENWWIYISDYGVKPNNPELIQDAVNWCKENHKNSS